MNVKDRIEAKRVAAAQNKAAGLVTPQAGFGTPLSSSSRAARFRAAGAGLDVDLPDPERELGSSGSVASSVASVAHPGQVPGSVATSVASVSPPAQETTSVAFSVASVASVASQVLEPVRNEPLSSSSTPKSRAERFRATIADAPRRAPTPEQTTSSQVGHVSRRSNQEVQSWEDDDRPAGSMFSEEEWRAAEVQNPGCIVMEMLKPEERSLVAMPHDAIDPLFKRSLVIDVLVDTPWKANATCSVEHHGQLGVFNYLVVRCETERRKCDWMTGAKLVIKDKAAEASPRELSRSERFRA